MRLGSFIELKPGIHGNFSIAQIVAVDKVKNLLLCRWLFRPEDLPPAIFTPPRTRETFSSRELLLCEAEAAVKTDEWHLPSEVLREVKVTRGVSQGGFLYRQTFDPSAHALRPELAAEVFHEHGRFLVENPDDVIFQCVACNKKFSHSSLSSEENSRNKFPGYFEFTCGDCAQASWSVVPRIADEKRIAVVRKFEAAFNLAVTEMHSGVPDFIVGKKIPGLAAALEAALWEKGDYWPRARSLVFNLSDTKNPSLRRRVIIGELPLAQIISADAAELANDKLREQRRAQQEKYYHEQVLLGRAADEEPDAKKPRTDHDLERVNALEALIIAPPPPSRTHSVVVPVQPVKPVKLSAMAAELLRDCESIENASIRELVKLSIKR